MWLDIDYKNRELVSDEAVVRMLAAIRTTIFGESSKATVEGYSVALSQLRQIMAACRGDRELFERAGYSLDKAIQALQMLDVGGYAKTPMLSGINGLRLFSFALA